MWIVGPTTLLTVFISVSLSVFVGVGWCSISMMLIISLLSFYFSCWLSISLRIFNSERRTRSADGVLFIFPSSSSFLVVASILFLAKYLGLVQGHIREFKLSWCLFRFYGCMMKVTFIAPARHYCSFNLQCFCRHDIFSCWQGYLHCISFSVCIFKQDNQRAEYFS